MFRALTVITAVVALVISAAPASALMLSQTQDLPAISAAPASAGTSITKKVLYNGHAGLINNGTADDQMTKAAPKPCGIVVTKPQDCPSTKLQRPRLAEEMTESLIVRGKTKAQRRGASLSGGIPDGTSNTIGIASTSSPLGASGIIMRDGGICDPIRHMGC